MPLVKRNKNSCHWVLEKSEIEDIIMYPNEKHYKFCPHIWLGYIKYIKKKNRKRLFHKETK